MTTTDSTDSSNPTTSATGAAGVSDLVADPRPAFARAVDTLVEVATGIDADQLRLPTPCTGMDVRALLDHVAMALGRAWCVAKDVPLEQWPGEEASAGDAWADALRRAGEAAVVAWAADDARLQDEVPLPWTVSTGAGALGVYVNEIVVHTWDLARATGQSPVWEDRMVATADACIRAQLPVAARGPMWAEFKSQLPDGVPWADPFVDAVPMPDDAPAIDRLVAWNGRQPS